MRVRNLLLMNLFTFVYKYDLQRIALPVHKKTKPAAFLNGIPNRIGTVPIENKEEKRIVMLFSCETTLWFLEVPIGILPVKKAADYNYY